jgi:hypothetical protein
LKVTDFRGVSQIIELSDESAALLKRQASAHGLTVQAWVQVLAYEKARTEDTPPVLQKAQAAVSRILELQKRVKPDPEGWTIRDYIDHGRP